MLNGWVYENMPFDEAAAKAAFSAGNIAMVYCLKHIPTGRLYIGKKLLITKIRRPPLKGKKRVRICEVETNWRKYFSSSEYIAECVKRDGKESFERHIIKLCKTKSEVNYCETALHILVDVLHTKLDDGSRAFFNENIARIWYANNTPPQSELLDAVAALSSLNKC